MAERLPRVSQPLPLIAVRAGQRITRQGEPGPGIWLVETGALISTTVTPDGHPLGLDVVGPRDVVGEPPGHPSPCDARALKPCRLRPLPMHRAGELLAIRASRAAALAERLAWAGVEARVRWRLTDLAVRFGRPLSDGTLVALPLTQDDLAALAGTSRESANRAIRSLVRTGQIEVISRGRYVVLTPTLRAVGFPA